MGFAATAAAQCAQYPAIPACHEIQPDQWVALGVYVSVMIAILYLAHQVAK